MDERTREMIASYLPHPRDRKLEEGEFYVMDNADRCQRVMITDIFPHLFGCTTYGVVRSSDERIVSPDISDPYAGYTKSELYDNRTDCREMSHSCFDGWEELRRIQLEEAPDFYTRRRKR